MAYGCRRIAGLDAARPLDDFKHHLDERNGHGHRDAGKMPASQGNMKAAAKNVA